MNRLRRLTIVTVATTYALVTVGGLVRATDSGLGCGDDWPRCNGAVVPVGNHHTWIEFGHRSIAAVLVALSVTLAVLAWRHARDRRDVRGLAYATVPIVLAQAAVGAVVVILELHATSVVIHLLLAMGFFAVLLALLVRQVVPEPDEEADSWPARAAWPVALGALGVMLLGSYVSGREAGLAYTSWPLFDGGVIPSGRGELGWLHGFHRFAAAASGLSVLWLFWTARRRHAHPAVTRLVAGAGGLFAVQILVGASNVWTDLNAATRTLHLAVAAAIWGLLSATALAAPRLGRAPAHAVAPAGTPAGVPGVALRRARAYFLLTKPRVIELLLVTTIPAMVLAERGWPSPGLMLAVLAGGALAAGGANAINCYIDRERDATMARTRRRPLPAGEIDPDRALRFGLALEVAAFVVLAASANLLAASLAISATVFYVFVYSIWLKPRTAQNIVIGGAAGAVPVLVGWAAVTSDLASPAWVLFAIIFVWTPPHFWALSMKYRDDYAAAGVPMMPVVAGIDSTTRQILGYSVVVVAVTLLLHPVADLGALYLTAALGLGGAFLWRAFRLRREGSPGAAMRMFTFSNAYLALLFTALAADVIVLSGA